MFGLFFSLVLCETLAGPKLLDVFDGLVEWGTRNARWPQSAKLKPGCYSLLWDRGLAIRCMAVTKLCTARWGEHGYLVRFRHSGLRVQFSSKDLLIEKGHDGISVSLWSMVENDFELGEWVECGQGTYAFNGDGILGLLARETGYWPRWDNCHAMTVMLMSYLVLGII